MSVINVSHLVKDYGSGRGVFDIGVSVEKGECYGFLGPNGAGKTTTIRHLMGFSKPQSGSVRILGKECYAYSAQLQDHIGYLPGEIALPPYMTGVQFLRQIQQMRHIDNDDCTKKLLQKFELEPNQSTKQMSLGVKRKLAIVTTFLHDPEVLILDEPTSGLDPIMQQTFISFIEEEKARGKTIFLSSHIFHEVDAVCDKIAIIRGGKIVSEFLPEQLKKTADKIYMITFADIKSFKKFIALDYKFTSVNDKKLRVRVRISDLLLSKFTKDLSMLNIADFIEIPFTLEDYFMQFYRQDTHFEEVRR